MKKAIISDCGQYRYELHREWDKKKKKVLFIMLNPSTADGLNNDLTTIRCINFAKKWGYGGIMIGNIYPFRAKRPKDLRKWIDDDTISFESYSSNVAHVEEITVDGGETEVTVTPTEDEKVKETKEKSSKKRTWF